ncbi:hypothetical protein [Streptomyces sp. NPDC002889]|uniref:hypothetical protein n=1 Tax=Streptomyces sp. NPDC002889 TaxID=3364669 RepID=UPI003685FAC8
MRSCLPSVRSLPLFPLIMAAVLVLPTPQSASAAQVPDTPSRTAQQGQGCGELRVTATLPVPPAGMAVRQEVSVGGDCKPDLGPVRFVPAPDGRHTAADRRELRTWSEMYDCCGILMTALYTTTTTTSGNVSGGVSQVNTTVRHDWNREPWDGGWSLTGTSQTGDCLGACPGARAAAHAEFGYRGFFDLTGGWYSNIHDSTVQLNGDGTASCRLDVTLRHTFIGWRWVRGCA